MGAVEDFVNCIVLGKTKGSVGSYLIGAKKSIDHSFLLRIYRGDRSKDRGRERLVPRRRAFVVIGRLHKLGDDGVCVGKKECVSGQDLRPANQVNKSAYCVALAHSLPHQGNKAALPCSASMACVIHTESMSCWSLLRICSSPASTFICSDFGILMHVLSSESRTCPCRCPQTQLVTFWRRWVVAI